MPKGAEGWNSFWDVVTPEEAARKLIQECGSAAAEAAASRVQAARLNDREVDLRFWRPTLKLVRTSQNDERASAWKTAALRHMN